MKWILLLSVLLTTHQSFAQTDGDILESIKLDDLDALITYIQTTEKRDTVSLDPARFKHFQDVQVFGITYLSDGLKIKGFLLKPKDEGLYPAVIYNRGGSREWGSLTHHVASIGLGELAELARAGFVVVASQYRGNGGSEGMEEYGGRDLNDVLNLIPLLAHVPEADTAKIGMFGWSRGAMTTFLTLKQKPNIKAAVVGGPSTNLVAATKHRPELPEWWATFIPNYYEHEAAFLKARSAVYWVDELPRDVPLLLMQGTADWHVQSKETLLFALELDRYRIPYRLIMYEGSAHAIRAHHNAVFAQLIDWFKRFLTEGETVSIATPQP